MRLSGVLFLVAATVATVSCSESLPVSDRCVFRIVTITPQDTSVHVGDTLTMHVAFTPDGAKCYPNTTSAGLRWASEDTGLVLIDPLTGHLTALSAGTSLIGIQYPGATAMMGVTWVTITP